ncbi:hypothetical protein EDC04DRAFT_3112504 [Pisolithus marmoratus]|nr:hypothetical protein EDC04DRAFT_3112504 [Pisolithus marmoratus]
MCVASWFLRVAHSCHWFDWSGTWPQFSRTLCKGGLLTTLLRILSTYPHLTPLILRFSESHDTTSATGQYWQRPGRNMLLTHLLDVPEPSSILATTGARGGIRAIGQGIRIFDRSVITQQPHFTLRFPYHAFRLEG